MTFDEVLEQVITLLKRQGRVSYRALKMRLDIDDEYLDVLKEELLYVHPIIDDAGKGLIWTGESGIQPEPVSTSQPTQTSEQPPTQQDQPTQAEPPPIAPSTPDAERRQITVMFSDLVDSTWLSGQLDPEDYREVLRAYQATCAEAIQPYDAFVAQHLGDGVLVYFGYPQAHEDDAQRAIHAGLGIIEALGPLNTRLEREKGIRVAVRIGIHTGPVVVGEIGGGDRQELLALGPTPNISSRVQGIAEPDTIAISEATYRLIEGYFTVEDLGLHTLKGVTEPMRVYRVLQESGVQSRLDIASARGLTPLVGREQEVGLLLERWHQVKDGQGQVVLLSGEGGIGKSRLVQVLKEHVADEPHTRWECRSSPYYQNTALYPITDLFQRTLQFQANDTPEQRLEKLEQELSQYRLSLKESIPLFAPLLSLPIPEERYPPLALSPQRQRQKTLEAIVAILLELAEQQPVLFVLEDLHWTDPSTIELLDLLIDQIPTTSICTLLTCRPAFQPTWSHRSYLTEVTINRLSRNHIERMAEQVADGKKLPDEVLKQIVEKTDGVPLFVEEMVKAVLESGTLKEVNGQYELAGSFTTLTIPATLQDSLMARLDRLVTAKGLAQQASVLGRQFTYELLQAVSQLHERTLQDELHRLVEAELLYQRGLPPQATYTFKHALIRDAAYESLLKSTRQQYHQRIAQTLEDRFAETAENQPELLAYHCMEAGLNEQAVGFWHKAGEQAVQHSANQEGIYYLTKGLELLKALPDTAEHTQQELVLLTVVGPALIAHKGPAAQEVAQTYTRAFHLCQQMGDTPQNAPVLWGLWVFYTNRAEHQRASELCQQLLTVAVQDPAFFLETHFALGTTLYLQGSFAAARDHLEQALTVYDVPQHHALAFRYGYDPGVNCLRFLAMTLWCLGYADHSLGTLHDALTLAQRLAHPFSIGAALCVSTWLYQFRRESWHVHEQADALTRLAHEHGFTHYVAVGALMKGWALAQHGEGNKGIVQMKQGLAAWQDTGSVVLRPYYLALLAEVYGKEGQSAEGLHLLDEALTVVDNTKERSSEAELHRLKGELLLQRSPDNQTEAETCFQKAIAIAQNQSAKSWELRAATSLSRLWQSQNKRQEAYDLLAPVYGWFTEGFDTADLKDAKALLDELTEGRYDV